MKTTNEEIEDEANKYIEYTYEDIPEDARQQLTLAFYGGMASMFSALIEIEKEHRGNPARVAVELKKISLSYHRKIYNFARIPIICFILDSCVAI